MLFPQAKDRVQKVVIDAGHGGTAPGCVGKKSKEKDVNLIVALKLGKLISDNFKDVQVIYTRKSDISVEVYRRAEIANNAKADLFISIHCNASENKSAHGIETYVMGLEKSEASLAVTKKENADILLEKDYKDNYGEFDPNSPEANIILSMYNSAYLKNSATFASKVQNNLVKNSRLTDRGVMQGAFWVLYKVAMPSILVELGFLSNTTEEQFLIKNSTQELMAISIYNAFVEYKNLLEGTSKELMAVPKIEQTEMVVPTQKDTATTDTAAPITADAATKTDDQAAAETINSKTQITTPESNSTQPSTSSSQPPTSNNDNGIRFRVQFLATPENLNVSDKKFANLSQVKKFKEGNLWKYTAGDALTFEEAQVILKTVKTYYSDAFIIAFENEQKISVQEAIKKR